MNSAIYKIILQEIARLFRMTICLLRIGIDKYSAAVKSIHLKGAVGILLGMSLLSGCQHADLCAGRKDRIRSSTPSDSLASVRDVVVSKEIKSLPGFTNGLYNNGGVSLYYEIAGSGPPLVFVHAHTVDRRMWDCQFMEFAKTNRVMRYDVRGYGASDAQDESHCFRHADDLADLMRGVGIPAAHIVGLSMGSFILGDMLALHPDMVLSATFACGGVYDGVDGDLGISVEQHAKSIEKIKEIKSRGISAWKTEWINMLVCGASPRHEVVRREIKVMIDEWSGWQLLHAETTPCLLGSAIEGRLRGLDLPVRSLGIFADHDSEWTHRDTRRMLALLPMPKETWISNAGHFANMDQPDEFNRILRAFLVSVIDEQP
jgi:pimeloyl-ACP methyl ester carboxylesterase